MIKFNSTNYILWKNLIEHMLYNKDLYDPILGGNGKSSDKFDAKWKKMNWKTDAIIRQWLDLSAYPHVEGETDAQKL